MGRASIEDPRRCNCGRGPWPGTKVDHAEIDDVRRCEHGNIWRCYSRGFGPRFERLSRFWQPRLWRRANQALDTTGADS